MFNILRLSYLYGLIAIITSIINLILFGVIFGSSLALLYIYGIDCLTTGGCEILSWVLSILSIIYMIATTIIIIAAVSLKDKFL